MYIKNISLKNFRNYSSLNVSFSRNMNVFIGANAQGKTNLLESIFLCAMGKSFKYVSEKEIIKIGEKFSDVRISYVSEGRDMENRVCLFTDKKKVVWVNDVPLHKLSELIGKLTVVIFTPEELSLIKDGPFARRRFLDMLISQVRPKYMRILSDYNKVLERKNKLLKDIVLKPELKETISIWNSQLAEYGAEIIKYRMDFIKIVLSKAEKIHLEISGNTEKLTGKYKTADVNLKDRENLRENLIKILEENEEREILLRQAVIGPHRDDVIFYLNDKNVKIFGSQGQQRTVVLSLKLAQKEIFFSETGENPILLLDDITGELDISRREYLFSKIKDSQVFITCTDSDRTPEKGGEKYFRIVNGNIPER